MISVLKQVQHYCHCRRLRIHFHLPNRLDLLLQTASGVRVCCYTVITKTFEIKLNKYQEDKQKDVAKLEIQLDQKIRRENELEYKLEELNNALSDKETSNSEDLINQLNQLLLEKNNLQKKNAVLYVRINRSWSVVIA